jgi:hypothetical protein
MKRHGKRGKQKLQKLELAFVCKRHFQKSCSQDLAFLLFYQLFNIFIVVRLFVIVFGFAAARFLQHDQQVPRSNQSNDLFE